MLNMMPNSASALRVSGNDYTVLMRLPVGIQICPDAAACSERIEEKPATDVNGIVGDIASIWMFQLTVFSHNLVQLSFDYRAPLSGAETDLWQSVFQITKTK
jgi:hypothetical protein